MNRKLRFHEEKIMKLEQIQFEMEKMMKNQKSQRGKNQSRNHEQKLIIDAPRSSDPREQLAYKLQAKGVAGHFYGNDKSRGNGGVRNAMTEPEVNEILKLISHGETKINFKFERTTNKYQAFGWVLDLGYSFFHICKSLFILNKFTTN